MAIDWGKIKWAILSRLPTDRGLGKETKDIEYLPFYLPNGLSSSITNPVDRLSQEYKALLANEQHQPSDTDQFTNDSGPKKSC